MGVLSVLRGLVQRFGPYLIIELLLPGGSLLALLLFLYERRKGALGKRAPWLDFDLKHALRGVVDQYRPALQPNYLRPSQVINSIWRER